jgi:hypothetical protein
MYPSVELLTNLLQFFAMDADAQLDYAKGIPSTLNDRAFPFGLDHSPLIELVNGTNNIARVFVAEKNVSSEAVEAIEDFETMLELIRTQRLEEALNWTGESLRTSIKWRIVRKLSRTCLQKLGISPNRPAIAYEDLVSLVMD